MGKYYVYRHIRLDKNEVFYIGIGSKRAIKTFFKTERSEYTRAYDVYSRSKYWKNIYKQSKVKVEILIESDNLSFIKTKEQEFITLYGRKDLNLGTLVNLTDGGDGAFNLKSITRLKGNNHNACVNVFIYKVDGTFIEKRCGIKAMCRDYKLNESKVWQQMNGLRIQHKGYRFFYKFQGEKIKPLSYYGSGCAGIPVIQLDSKGNSVNEFKTLKNAAKSINVNPGKIKTACENNTLLSNYYWQYKY